jgi:hypothetical protein
LKRIDPAKAMIGYKIARVSKALTSINAQIRLHPLCLAGTAKTESIQPIMDQSVNVLLIYDCKEGLDANFSLASSSVIKCDLRLTFLRLTVVTILPRNVLALTFAT